MSGPASPYVYGVQMVRRDGTIVGVLLSDGLSSMPAPRNAAMRLWLSTNRERAEREAASIEARPKCAARVFRIQTVGPFG